VTSDATRPARPSPVTSEATQHVPDGPLNAGAGKPTEQLPKFGRYQATATLGAGAMGTVYRAHDDLLGRDVAIKTLTASGELGIRERFIREARAIGAVHHPNILAVHDVGEENDTPFLVMELAAGGSLRERIKGPQHGGPLPVETVRELGLHIARALAAAHAAGIIHRDVKPANILCATPVGHPPLWKLADFGIAHVPDSTLTMTGQFLGSPSYAAPESLRAGQFSAASDVYSLGATLYEALAGSPPHGDHDMQSLVRKLEQEAPPLHTKNPAAPRALADPIMAALASDPTKRPSADALARMLAADDAAALPVTPAPGVPITPPPPLAAAPIAGAAVAHSGGSSMKWIAAGLIAIALVAIVLAVKNSSSDTKNSGSGSAQPMTDESGATSDEPTPMVIDQYGNPVDEETAKQILQQMEEDARDAYDHPGKGRGRKKKYKE
jgi:eukaryotic-like serine/threonine-protein kinase